MKTENSPANPESMETGKELSGKAAHKIRSGWAKFWLATFSVVLVFGLLEGAARIYVAKVYGKSTFGMMWKFSYEPFTLMRTNDKFYREIPPKGDNFRILLLGGSTADLMPDAMISATFSKALNRKVDVVNLGQGGFVLNQELVAFALHGIKTKPDLVLTIDGANDLMNTAKTGKPGLPYSNDFIAMAVEKPITNAVFGILRHSQFVNCLNKLRERQFEKKVHADQTLINQTVDLVGEAHLSISSMAHGCNAPHVMVLQPYLHLRKTIVPEEKNIIAPFLYRGEYTGKGMLRILERLESQRAQHVGESYLIDGLKAFDTTTGLVFKDEAHFTEPAKQIFCDYIVSELTKQGFFQKHALPSKDPNSAGAAPH